MILIIKKYSSLGKSGNPLRINGIKQFRQYFPPKKISLSKDLPALGGIHNQKL